MSRAYDLCPICASALRPYGPDMVECRFCGFKDERE